MTGATGETPPDPAPATTRRSRLPAAWGRRGFRQLARAWIFSNTADSVLYLMAAVWIKDLSGSDAAAGLAFAAMGLSSLASPFLGQLADRLPRRLLIVVANALMVPVVLTLLWVTPDRLWLIYAVILAYGSVGYLTAAAQSGLIRDLLPDEELAGGNAMLSTVDQALKLIAPLLGTTIYAVYGPQAVVYFTVTFFLIAGLLLWGLEVLESPPTAATERQGYWTELSAGFRHIARTPVLALIVVVIAVGFGSTGLANVAVFPAMELGLGVPAATLGLLVSLQGIGALIGGATAAGRIAAWGERRTVAAGITMLGLGILPMTGTSVVLAAIGLMVLGLGVSWSLVAMVTARQRLTPPQLQGRAAGATGLSINLTETLLTLLAAAIIGFVDYRLLIVGTSVTVLVAAVLARPWKADAPLA